MDKTGSRHVEKKEPKGPHMVKKDPHKEKNVVERPPYREKVAKSPPYSKKIGGIFYGGASAYSCQCLNTFSF